MELKRKSTKAYVVIAIVVLLSLSIVLPQIYHLIARKGVEITFVDDRGIILDYVEIYVQVEALVPEGPPDRIAPVVELYRGRVEGGKLFFRSDEDRFKEVIEAWIKEHPRDKGLETAIKMDIWANLDGRAFRFPVIAINYNPIRASEELIRRMVKLSLYEEDGHRPLRGHILQPYCFYLWEEDLALSWRSNVFVRVPVLIVHNDYPQLSGVINTGIGIVISHESGFKFTVGYGYHIKSNLYAGQTPSVDFYTVGFSRGGYYYAFIHSRYVWPGKTYWFWISAKIAHVHYREIFVCDGFSYYTGLEKIESYVYDVQVSGTTIIGGVEARQPPYASRIFDGSREIRPYISGTELSDGMLSVKESVYFSKIFDWFDIYDQDFEVGLPLGAIAVVTAANLAGLPASAISFISGITASIIFVSGHLENFGQFHNIGANVVEHVYIRISRFKFKDTLGRLFDVPMGVWFRCY